MSQVAPGLLQGLLASGWVFGAAIIGLAGVAAAVAALARCRHPGPLGLLPPVKGDDGERRPARWFCEACGRTWPAVELGGPSPVPRFAGYDQSKAVAAAQRADDTARRRREIAMERSDQLAPRPVPAKRERGPRPIDMQNRRAG